MISAPGRDARTSPVTKSLERRRPEPMQFQPEAHAESMRSLHEAVAALIFDGILVAVVGIIYALGL